MCKINWRWEKTGGDFGDGRRQEAGEFKGSIRGKEVKVERMKLE